ncbi:MAG: GNAT family N-acetyltransferase [Pseudomonadota bacterium]
MTCGHIRLAVQSDAESISALIIVTLRETNATDYSPEIIDRLVDNFTPENVVAHLASREVLVAVQGDIIIGTASLEQSRARTVFVHPSMQGKGVGALLMEEIEALALGAGLKILHVNSSISAQGFYQRLGYSKVRDEYFEDERTIVMSKSINQDD